MQSSLGDQQYFASSITIYIKKYICMYVNIWAQQVYAFIYCSYIHIYLIFLIKHIIKIKLVLNKGGLRHFFCIIKLKRKQSNVYLTLLMDGKSGWVRQMRCYMMFIALWRWMRRHMGRYRGICAHSRSRGVWI